MFLVFHPTPPAQEMRCPPLPFHHGRPRWWFSHGVPSTGDLRVGGGVKVLGSLVQPEPGHLFDTHVDATSPSGPLLPLSGTPPSGLAHPCIPQYRILTPETLSLAPMLLNASWGDGGEGRFTHCRVCLWQNHNLATSPLPSSFPRPTAQTSTPSPHPARPLKIKSPSTAE